MLLLLVSFPCYVDAAIVSRKIMPHRIPHIGKISQEVGPIHTTAAKAADKKQQSTRLTPGLQTLNKQILPEKAPGLIGKVHEGSKMGIPMQHVVAVQEVWLVPTGGQKFLFFGSFVYIIFGLAVAYCYYQARLRDEKVFVPRPEPGVFPRTTGFSFDLFSCLSDPKICVMGFCCPCLRWADTLDKQDIMAFGPAFFIMFVLSLISVHTQGIMGVGVVLVGVMARHNLRKKYDMDRCTFGTVLSDCAVWLCCQPCAIIQEAREESVQRAGV